MKAEATITRDPLKEKRLEMLGRLPEFCRILRVYPSPLLVAYSSWATRSYVSDCAATCFA